MHLDQITPMQTSYTQSSASAEVKSASNGDKGEDKKSSDIEPSKDSDSSSSKSSNGEGVKDSDIQ